jgi:hypothetical protein
VEALMNCPRCQQPLPDPPERFCPNCGAELEGPAETLSGTILPPPPPPPYGGPPPPPPPPSDGNPWERRDRVGFVSALVETTQQILTRPSSFFRSLSPEGGVGSALVYAVVVGYVGAVAAALYNFVANALMPGFGGFGGPEMERLRPFLEGPGVLIGTLILGPIFVVLEVAVWSGLVHVALLVLGGARRGIETTARTVCFAEAANLAKIIPFCGGVIAFIFFIVLLVIGVSETHGISRGKATAAVLLPLFLCCCCGALAGFFLVTSLAALQR